MVLNGESAIRKALLQHSTEFAGRPNFVSFQSVSGGTSMTFTSYSKLWKMHRKIAQSTIRAFSSANSQTKKSFEKHIAAEAEELIETFLRLSSNNQYFNPSHELTVAAANIICALCFGKRYGHDDLEFRTLLSKVNKFGENRRSWKFGGCHALVAIFSQSCEEHFSELQRPQQWLLHVCQR